MHSRTTSRDGFLDLALRLLLIGAGAFDLIAAFVLLLAPRWLSATLNLPLPADLFYVWFIGMLQIGLALAYLIGGLNPIRYAANVKLAAAMRLAMSGLLFFVGLRTGFTLFIVLGSVELVVGLAHTLYATRLAAIGSYETLAAVK